MPIEVGISFGRDAPLIEQESRGIEDELFVGVAALEKLVRLSSSLKRKMVLATEAKSAPG